MTELIDLPGPPGLFATRGVQNFPTKPLSGGRPTQDIEPRPRTCEVLQPPLSRVRSRVTELR